LTSYKLAFKKQALKEWRKLGTTVQKQFKTKLATVLKHPHIEASRLSGSSTRYKIKLRSAGYRLVYEVRDQSLIVIVIAVGKRERNAVYKAAVNRR
jgi:mRNA interferase RelE/StbE